MSDAILILEHVVKSYGKVTALSGLNLRVSEGEILGFVGPNGAGKTTALKIMSALLVPDSGSISLGGIDVQIHPQKAKKLIGYLPDLPLLYENLTVFETLKMYAVAWSLQFDRRRALRTLAEYGVKPLWNRRVRTLSKGQKQRLSLICALLHEPRILLFDEPFTGLDIESREFMRNKIGGWANGAGKAIVISSHDLADIQKLCSTIALIVKGKIVSSGTEDEVRTKVLGRVFKIVLEEPPSSLDGLVEYTEEYSVVGDTITFSLGNGQDVDTILRYFIDTHRPVRSFRPLDLEEVLLEILKKEKS